MIEVERKFRLTRHQAKQIRSAWQAKYGKLKSARQTDEIFLFGVESFKDFKAGMPVARLRNEDTFTVLTFKRTVDGEGDSVEHETIVGSANVMKAILLEMGYRSVSQVVKDRLVAREGKISFMLDNVHALGDFLEIEAIVAHEKEIPYIKDCILREALLYGLTERNVEPKKYDWLLANINTE